MRNLQDAGLAGVWGDIEGDCLIRVVCATTYSDKYYRYEYVNVHLKIADGGLEHKHGMHSVVFKSLFPRRPGKTLQLIKHEYKDALVVNGSEAVIAMVLCDSVEAIIYNRFSADFDEWGSWGNGQSDD